MQTVLDKYFLWWNEQGLGWLGNVTFILVLLVMVILYAIIYSFIYEHYTRWKCRRRYHTKGAGKDGS